MESKLSESIRSALEQRAVLLQQIRKFFAQRDVLEVETPALSQAANSDPAIESFEVNTAQGLRYLHTSPEYPMKRLLAQGSGDIYQICKVWRDEEQGRFHNPEFTMLEWYRTGFSYYQLMDEVADLLSFLFPEINDAPVLLSYEQAFVEILDVNPHSCTQQMLEKRVASLNVGCQSQLSRSELLDLLMVSAIEPAFNATGFTFIYDYPAEQNALACVKDVNPPVAERFEVYFGRHELGNGYQEEVDPDKNTDILQRENEQRMQNNQRIRPLDERFLQAMTHGVPRASGIAMGIDRLLMCKTHAESLQDVITFPWSVA